jgi:hypothetical protein
LAADLHVKGWYEPFAHGSPWKSDDVILFLLAASDITVDLKGHSISSNAKLTTAGIETPIDGYPNHTRQPSLDGLKQVPKPSNVLIRNGALVLDSPSKRGIGMQFSYFFNIPASVESDLIGTWAAETGQPANESSLRQAKRWAKDLQEKLPKSASKYPNRNIRIENMSIRSSDVGIIVQGAGTVIRDSVIEVKTGTAIWIYGPNALIENNTIIVHGDYKLLDADAPIRLHHGNGAVIRGNRIIIAGNSRKRIISAFDTGSFTLEGNRFQGIGEKDELTNDFMGISDMRARDNHYE